MKFRLHPDDLFLGLLTVVSAALFSLLLWKAAIHLGPYLQTRPSDEPARYERL